MNVARLLLVEGVSYVVAAAFVNSLAMCKWRL
nr:MAG TPA: hypothetical protein [Caudoviricetes sp.]